MLADAGIPLASVPGSGPRGRIVRVDAERAIERVRAQPAPAVPTAPVVSAAGTATEPSRMRRAIAARLTESKQTVPHFYVKRTANVDRLLAMRLELNQLDGVRVSVNDLVVRAVALAHRAHPECNTIWVEGALRRFDSVDVSVAVSVDGGLLTPVVRSADAMPISVLADRTRSLAEQARTGGLRQDQLEGGAVTVSNLGMFDVDEFAAIINPPQSSILAVGAARRAPVVVGDDLTVAAQVALVLSADHRVIDGALAGQWLGTVVDLLENPMRLLA
jgi:pyruvate dehydrogenase E2 component (dihydrolipoamide acetyltransferase)